MSSFGTTVQTFLYSPSCLFNVACFCSVGVAAEKSHVSEGDRLLEVNGRNVRGLSHREAGELIAECPKSVHLLLHTRKPRPVPCGNTVYSGWLGKKGGSGITPRNWRRRWFVLKDDCIAYYYNSPEVRILAVGVCKIKRLVYLYRIHGHWVPLS